MWDQSERLGEGTFGIVHPGKRRRTGERVAIKAIKEVRADGLVEVCILENMRHPHIVQLLDARASVRGGLLAGHGAPFLPWRCGAVLHLAAGLRDLAPVFCAGSFNIFCLVLSRSTSGAGWFQVHLVFSCWHYLGGLSLDGLA